MRGIFTILFVAVALSACAATPQIGETLESFEQSCRAARFQSLTLLATDEFGVQAYACPGSEQIAVVEKGVIAAIGYPEQLYAWQEDNTCLSWGLKTGTADYVSCRMFLAEQRAIADVNAAMAQQQRAAALLNYSAALQALSRPAPPATSFNCTTTTQGAFTNTSCQ